MQVFVTGASGFVGSAVVRELIGAGHEVLGLARSEQAAQALDALGATAHRGALEDLDSLRKGAEVTDGVVHAAFINDFTDYAASGRVDLAAVETLADALAGSGRPLVVTSVSSVLPPGRLGLEDGPTDDAATSAPRLASERAAIGAAAHGVRSSAVRLPPSVHAEGDRHGFVPALIRTARATGVSAVVGDGANRWPAVHRADAARLYRLALEQARPGSIMHAVHDEGIPLREIASVLARHLDIEVRSVPEPDAEAHFGWLARFARLDNPLSSRATRFRLGWQVTGPGLLDDLDAGHYFRD